MKKMSFLLIAFSLLLFACQQTNSEKNELIEEELTVQDETEILINSNQIETAHLKLMPALFKSKLENSPGINLLDIRTPEELAENGSIEGAQNIDFYSADFEEQMNAMDREKPVMLYCKSGGRSGEAAALLKELGFKQVYDLNGGYDAWLTQFPNN